MTKSIPVLTHLVSATLCFAEFADTQTTENGLTGKSDVVVNSQGVAQRDLSIRGSSYAGSGVSVNGLNLKVPYSRHFGSELPFLAYLFSEPEIQTGLENRSGHLIGTAAYSTVRQKDRIQFGAEGGSKEQYRATATAYYNFFGSFLDWEKAHQVDYGANNYERVSGGTHVQHFTDDWQIDLIGAGQKKEFGAQGYYGIPANIYAEEETEDAAFVFGATKGELDDSFIRATAAWRQFDDLYRIPTSAFESDVRSRFGAVSVEGRTIEVQHIALNLRGDVEHEWVNGTIGQHDRTRGSVLILPEARFEYFTLKAGLNSVFQTGESAEWLPQAGIDWLAGDNSTVFAAYSETVQQPDFQTLFYSDPYRVGNSRLAQQKAQNTEIGFRQFLSENLKWNIGGFYRRLNEASDWVKKTAASAQWEATDLGSMNVYGLDAAVNYKTDKKLELGLFYQWLKKDRYDFYSGLYELDYPEHWLAFSGSWKFLDEFAVEYLQNFRHQTPNPVRTGDNFGTDASLGLHYFPRFANNVRLSFRVDNVWGSNFQAVPGLDRPPTTVHCGIAAAW